MRFLKVLALCLAVCGLAAASAQAYITTPAVPEYGRCKLVGLSAGIYKAGTCTELGGLKNHEWFAAFGSPQPLVGTHFKIANRARRCRT
jgi:hypothetical protein